MKNNFLGFWGETIKNVKLTDEGDRLLAHGVGECPKELLESKPILSNSMNPTQMISVPVCFEVSKETNKKNGVYRLYTPGEIDGFKIPPEFEECPPLLFECFYQEDKLKGNPIFYDKNGKRHSLILEDGYFRQSAVKNFMKKGRE